MSDDTIYRALKELGFSHLSARPRASKQDAEAIMARPVCKGFVRGDLISLRQRIRPVDRVPAKMEIRASGSS